MIGHMIGHYRILEEIGRGGMGVVYKALDTKLNRPVAIKSLQADTAQDEAARKRFIREAMVVAQLDHPYICKIYEIIEQGSQLFIVLEFVRGRPLSDLIADTSKPLPLEKALDLGREIAEALEEAHKSGVVHRDIKPKNIMLIESGHIKVLDFGLAKALQPSADLTGAEPTSLTEPGQIMGTPYYMSPEQITGQAADPRSDIFSFGVVMFEMIAGVRPFTGATAAQVIGAIMAGDSEPLHRYRKGVPDGLDRVIQRMLAKDPSERYQSVHEVWVELRHIREEMVARSSRAARAISQEQTISGAETVVRPLPGDVTLPPTATPVPVATPAPTARPGWMARRGRWALGLASVVGVVAVVVAIFWYQSSQPVLSFTARDWILVSDFENLTGDSIFDKSLATALNVSLSQSTYANVFSRSRTNSVLQRMGKKPDTPVDAQVGREICQRQNLRALVCPSIGKVGNVFVVTAQIVDPQTGDGVRSYAEQAQDYNQVLAALDKVAAAVRKGLGESLSQIRASSKPLADVTTTSLKALKLYSDAQLLWDKGEYKAAADAYESATKEDPDFAMAHAALGVLYSSFVFHDRPRAKEHYEKSLALADRTTDREKMVIRLQYEAQFGTYENTRVLYETYLRAYPDLIPQRFNYAGALRDHNEFDKAVEQYKEVIRIAPDHASARINLATTYSMQGKIPESLASYEQAFKLEPTWITNGNLNHEYGFTLVEAGDHEKARQVFNQALSTPIKPMGLRSLALLDLYEGKYRDAKGRLEEAILVTVSTKALLNEARNHVFMSILYDGLSDTAGVLRELDKAAKCLETIPPQGWLSARIGISYARNRALEKTATLLAVVQKNLNPNNAGDNSELHRFQGEIELARGNQAHALELLVLADREKHGPLTVESLARAQRLVGKTDDAIKTYEDFMKMRSDSDGWEPQQSWFAAHVDLAKLYIGRKDNEKARRVLDELLTLWKAADADLPLNKEAIRLTQTLGRTKP